MKKLAIAGSAVALAAMPIVGVFAADGDILNITDTIQLTVNATCTFNTDSSSVAANTTYSATGANGAVASLTNSSSHKFNVFCNDNDGWKVTVSDASKNLSGAAGNSHVITYRDQAIPAANAETEGYWSASVAGAGVTNTLSGITFTDPVYYIKPAGGIIAQEAASTDGSSFTVTYAAYVGTETAADTYTGTIAYTLAAL